MKRRIYAVLTALALLGSYAPTAAFATGYPVFDVSAWLVAIDKLYSAYDLVNNTITSIENQYKSIQHSIEVAQSIDWDNIRFDGDFDIRNDIKDANRRVNRLLTQARNIKETITTPSIQCGNVKYSIADLCGATTSDIWESRKNLLTAVQDYKYYMTSTMQSAVDGIVDGLDDKQRKAIWTKYGISPQNYVFCQQSADAVISAASKVMGKATDEAKQLTAEEKLAKANAIIDAALENVDSDGNPTMAGMTEANLHLSEDVLEQLMDLGYTMSDIGNMVAAKLIADDAEKQATADENAQKTEIQSRKNRKISNRMKKE